VQISHFASQNIFLFSYKGGFSVIVSNDRNHLYAFWQINIFCISFQCFVVGLSLYNENATKTPAFHAKYLSLYIEKTSCLKGDITHLFV